jgi:two-component system sensor histidine kinase/response regulator
VVLQAKTAPQAAHGCCIHFTVRDTGIGIPVDKQRLIFQPFTQADGSTTRKYGGTGLGLTICARLVEMMHGRIWVESEVGHGSQFHFTAHLGAAKTVAPAEPIEPLPFKHAAVLVVDDNATTRRLLQDLLRRWDMRATVADNAQAAFDLLHQARQDGKPFTVVLTDAHMPDRDGFTLVEQLKQHPDLAEIIMVMVSPVPNVETQRAAKSWV